MSNFQDGLIGMFIKKGINSGLTLYTLQQVNYAVNLQISGLQTISCRIYLRKRLIK